MDFTKANCTAEIKKAAALPTLDDGLAHLMALIDPNNEHDLGGHAGIYFSDDAGEEAEATWPTQAHDVRCGILSDWLAWQQKQFA